MNLKKDWKPVAYDGIKPDDYKYKIWQSVSGDDIFVLGMNQEGDYVNIGHGKSVGTGAGNGGKQMEITWMNLTKNQKGVLNTATVDILSDSCIRRNPNKVKSYGNWDAI